MVSQKLQHPHHEASRHHKNSVVLSQEVDITDMYTVQAGAFSQLFAAQGMCAGRGGKVLKVEMRMKSEQAVRNFGI